eukprot:1690793-Heterocapsa_arctica.AAC.1
MARRLFAILPEELFVISSGHVVYLVVSPFRHVDLPSSSRRQALRWARLWKNFWSVERSSSASLKGILVSVLVAMASTRREVSSPLVGACPQGKAHCGHSRR